MEISGSYTFNAPPDRVWDLLMDPAVISSCIPGCDRFEPDGEDRYNVTLTVGLAAITGTYNGTVVLTDKIPHTSYRLVVEGQGRPGFVKGSSAIALRRRRGDNRGGRDRNRADRRSDRTRRSAADRRRREDDARSILRVPAGEACVRRAFRLLARASARSSARSVKTGIIARRYSWLAWMSELMSSRLGAGEPRGGLDAAHGQRFSGERLLHVRQARGVRARAGHADSRRLNRPVVHVQRGRHPDDGEV